MAPSSPCEGFSCERNGRTEIPRPSARFSFSPFRSAFQGPSSTKPNNAEWCRNFNYPWRKKFCLGSQSDFFFLYSVPPPTFRLQASSLWMCESIVSFVVELSKIVWLCNDVVVCNTIPIQIQRQNGRRSPSGTLERRGAFGWERGGMHSVPLQCLSIKSFTSPSSADFLFHSLHFTAVSWAALSSNCVVYWERGRRRVRIDLKSFSFFSPSFTMETVFTKLIADTHGY